MTVLGGTRPAHAATAHREVGAPHQLRKLLHRGWPAAWGASLGTLLFLVARRAMPDDALISLSYARNLAEHGQWALSTGIEAHTATSPLNIGLLAGLHLATGGRAFVAAGLLLCACLAVVAMLLRRLGGAFPALTGPALLASSPVLSSSVGLETFLTAAVLVALVTVAVEGRWVCSGLLVAAAVLTRPDLVVPAAAVVGLLALCHLRLLAAPLVGAAAAAPWLLFSWWHFGSAWPHTVAVKMAAGAWPQGSITTVSYFYGAFPAATVVTLATFTAGLAATAWALWHGQWPAAALGTGGAAHLVALAVQDTPPIEYYLAPGVIGLGLALVLAVRGVWRGVPLAIVAGAVALSVGHGSLWSEGLAPMRQNWATNDQYAAIAAGLPADGVVLSTTEIGALAFYCQDRGCTVIDPILADPGSTDRYVARWRTAHPWAEVNFVHYEPAAPLPVGYRLTFGPADPWPGDWPITRAPGVHQVARLVPAR